jgi:NADPH:quinone reductase
MVAAVRVHKAGGPDVLTYEQADIPAPGPNQIRVKQAAAGINYIDTYFRTGAYPPPNGYPLILGNEGSGDVIAVGPGVTDFKVGDRVTAVFAHGGYAAERNIPVDRAVKLPANISHQQAAGMMLKGMTAEYLLRRTYKVQKGDTILVHAAAGGVGLILCQWAHALGATVIGTVGTEEKAELARAHGCDHPIVYSKQDFVAEVNRITNGEKLPVVYDGVGRSTFLKSLDCLRVRGLMVSFGNASGPVDPFQPVLLSQKGSLYLTRPTLYHYIASRQQLEQSANELFEVVTSGKVKIEVKQRFPLKDAAEAHRALQERKTTGSTILTI